MADAVVSKTTGGNLISVRLRSSASKRSLWGSFFLSAGPLAGTRSFSGPCFAAVVFVTGGGDSERRKEYTGAGMDRR